MKERFLVTGYFYTEGGRNLRKFLDIRRKETRLEEPDIMVVMMNPGSSRPTSGGDNSRCVTEAVPDKTQDQIMRVMERTNLGCARILNLSDVRERRSSDFAEFLQTDNAKDGRHSIFHESREDDYTQYFVKDAPVIFAWGVHEALRDLALCAIKRIRHPNPVGQKKPGCSFGYYHPLPPSTPKQEKWVETIVEAMNGT